MKASVLPSAKNSVQYPVGFNPKAAKPVQVIAPTVEKPAPVEPVVNTTKSSMIFRCSVLHVDTDDVAKQIRAVQKKLKQIDQLKYDADHGEKLNAEQLEKIKGENEWRKKLTELLALDNKF